ncbi:MAG: alpha-L-fucosidase [Spirochaetaceae bacterium]|jgi:alpha-L-fucosidase|nr:alpha-L-fucosidase [Spirochaetaceae bacterium]
MDLQKLTAIRPHERQIAWQKLEFTAFLHFGMNTFTHREWGTGQESPAQYNPSRLDTDQWCEVMQSAGIKACVLTAKHHDGFCLWDTRYTKHSVRTSPQPKDVVAGLAGSCKKYGLKLGLYLSPWDRHEPSYGKGEEYNDFFCGQLEEVLTRYGNLYSLWFDGACGEGANGKKQIYDWDRYYALIRRHQPSAVIASVGPDVRWIGNEAGATRPSEWSIVPAKLQNAHKIAGDSQQIDGSRFREQGVKHQDEDLGSRQALENEENLVWYPAEVDVSIRPGWFYHPEEDDKVKSLETLLRFYETAIGGNAVLLLNIPPDTEGRIHEQDRRRLSELGKRLKAIFSRNLLDEPGTAIFSNGEDLTALLKDDDSYWKSPGEAAEIEIILPGPRKISHLVLQEQIQESQRIEAFTIKEFEYSGTTVGYKKICRFEPAETNRIRIAIQESREFFTLRFIGAYLDA